MQPSLRALFIMAMSFVVVLLGTMAVVGMKVPLQEQNGIWLLLFALMTAATVLAARLFRGKS
jgi:quinol-cytochrome oxidoreductase complex cytochrome b subunit